MNKKLTTSELNRPSLEEYRGIDRFPIIVLLDDVRSLSNVGSIFRTCDGFNVEEVLLCGITGAPPHREIQRTALGATESVTWKSGLDAMEEIMRLKELGYMIISLEQCEQSASPDQLSLDLAKGVCLVVGNEVSGVNQDIIDSSDAVMEIPQYGTKHSFNVTVATGIALWELSKGFRD